MNKGFTLIELLIVIAIIGILAGIVITSIGDETDRASNAVVQLNVSTLRTLAVKEQISTSPPTNQAICTNVAASWKNGTFGSTSYNNTNTNIAAGNIGKVYCRSNGKRWTIWGITLNSDGTTPEAFCTDSLGNLKTLSLSTSGNIAKSATTFSC